MSIRDEMRKWLWSDEFGKPISIDAVEFELHGVKVCPGDILFYLQGSPALDVSVGRMFHEIENKHGADRRWRLCDSISNWTELSEKDIYIDPLDALAELERRLEAQIELYTERADWTRDHIQGLVDLKAEDIRSQS